MNNGSTAGPSGTATCIRSGHAIGGSLDVYVLQARGSDGYCGRTLSGRNINKAEFAAGFPDFTDVKENMSEEEFKRANEDLEKKVVDALNNIFGEETLQKVPNLIPVLRVGLASHLHVRDELEKLYPPDSPIRCTTLFTSPEILELKKYVKVTMPWEEDGLAYATGVPPHSIMLAQIEQLKHMVKDQPGEIERMMDDRVMSGVLSENRMRDLISTERKELMGKIDVLTKMFKRQSTSAVQAQNDANGVNNDGYQYWIVNGIRRKVPPNWTFPNGPIVNIYTESETTDIFYKCKNVLGIPERTQKNRKRNFAKLKVATVVREWRRLKKSRTANVGEAEAEIADEFFEACSDIQIEQV